MAEPSRKRDKAKNSKYLTPEEKNNPKLVIFDSNTDENPLIFWTLNSEDPRLINLTEFAVGKSAKDVEQGKHKWRGDFRGRPELISELAPAIKYLYGMHSSASLDNISPTLRFWWRVFDESETTSNSEDQPLKQVLSVADIGIIHHHIAKRKGITSQMQNWFIRVVNLVRSTENLPPLLWPSIQHKIRTSHLPEHWEIEKIRHALKRLWFESLDRWRAADNIKADLHGWKILCREKRKEHAFSTYRAVINSTDHPIPSSKTVERILGYKNQIEWMYPYKNHISKIYPTTEDIKSAFMLCLMYSGWNVNTLINLKINDRFVENHPSNSDYHIVFGLKARGQSEQHCIGRNKRSDSPGSILRELVKRTLPLRQYLEKKLENIDSKLSNSYVDNSEKLSLLKTRKLISHQLQTPWLYAEHQSCEPFHLTSYNFNLAPKGTFLRNIIQRLNLRQEPNKLLREDIKPGDFRDCYIGFAYEFSNYNILTAQIAAKHKSAATTQIYLQHKQWKTHSAKQIFKFQTIMFREIEERQSIDPTILRASMEFEVVTDNDRARLASIRKNRSRLGIACRDPKNPPESVVKNHISGGCRIHRCMLCPQNAILLPDSYDGIAMRVAELEYLRNYIPVTSWVNSGFPQELENSTAALQLYENKIVQERLLYWKNEINLGNHIPILSDGVQ